MSTPRLVQLLKFGAPVLILVWSIAYLFSNRAPVYNGVVRHFKNEKDLFISDFLEHEIDGRLDGSGIAKLCESKKWTPGLVLSCDPQAGGFGQVKNAHLNCIRFAIEMGAELVLPRVIKRDVKNIAMVRPSNGNAPYIGESLDYFFDREHLNQTLAEHCPQLKLYHSMDDLWNVPEVADPRKISLQEIGVSLTNGSVVEDMGSLPKEIQAYIDEMEPAEERQNPIRFKANVINWAFPTSYDSPELARNFGRILRVRKDARLLSTLALYHMQQRFGMDLDPKKGIKHSKFVGAHLRTEADARQMFLPFEVQTQNLLDFITNTTTNLAFIATGDTPDRLKTFSRRARDVNVTAVFKEDLLEDEPEGLELLDQLSWDQKALVDYEIMLRSGLMVGVGESSFSWNIALRRSALPGASEDPTMLTNTDIQYQDRYSTILGSSRSEKASVLQATIWP
ncbi:hypothetical protein QBC35DRAFT_103975 [Podospora australis]|uniref:Alternative oxidase n=1 Tax=Podospora australis TaxID=1536484 RepID=A0AAN7ALQ6_9PEZI|nr:hypothetical protein QBC35DRAFT_103975 [Podospora australis]